MTDTNINIGCPYPSMDSDYQKRVPISFLNFLHPTIKGNTKTCYGTCDEVMGCMQSDNIEKYSQSTLDYNYTGHSNGFSSNVIESKFMVSIYIFGRMSYLNSDSTVVPETTFEFEACCAIYDNLLGKYKSKCNELDIVYADSDGIMDQAGEIEFLSCEDDCVLNSFKHSILYH